MDEIAAVLSPDYTVESLGGRGGVLAFKFILK